MQRRIYDLESWRETGPRLSLMTIGKLLKLLWTKNPTLHQTGHFFYQGQFYSNKTPLKTPK